MLRDLRLHNFKAFEDVEIELRPITLLLGPNNSGKSALIAAIRLLVQTLESNDGDVSLLLNGIMGDFGTYRDIVFSNHRRRNLGIGVTVLSGMKIRALNRQNAVYLVDEKEPLAIDVLFSYRTIRREVILKKSLLQQGDQPILTTDYSLDSERQVVSSIVGIDIPASYKSSLSRSLRMNNFLPRNIYLSPTSENSKLSKLFDDKFSEISRRVSAVSSSIYRSLLNVDYVGAMRIPPERTYLFTGERGKRVGANGERAGSIMVMDKARGKSRSNNIFEKVNAWLSKAGTASQIRIISLSDRHYELRIQHPVTGEFQNLADVGYGNSQVIPVLIGGYNLDAGSTFLIEEPEIHLHPRAQAELGGFLLDLYKNGVQTITETHSEYIILRIQQYIANGLIAPEDVRIYYLYPSEKEKKIVPLDIDEFGKFTDEWPEGFFPERLDEATNLSKIRYRKQQGS